MSQSAVVQPLGSQGISIFKGQSKTYLLTVKEEPSMDPADLTGATVFFTVRRNLGDTATVIVKTSAVIAEIEIQVPTTDGQAKIFLSPSDTNPLAAGAYVYDVWVELVSGKRFPVIEPSPFNILTPVTTFP